MTEKPPEQKSGFSADWLMRGALSRLGDTFDRFTGRNWTPTSSLATSELVERMKKLLDTEAKQVPGKGTVVPHNIKLRIEWDKFATDKEEALSKLENELLVAAVDHINDSVYYTFAPVRLEVKPDYFTEGVKLSVSFDKTEDEVEMNVTVAGITVPQPISTDEKPVEPTTNNYLAQFEISDKKKEKRLSIAVGGRISVGRTGSNDLVLDDASVSKIHASLTAGIDGWLSVADTGSTNGTFINDERIAYGKATRLVAGDVVKFGVVAVTFEHLEAEVGEEAPDDATVEIEGFEFTSRESTVAPIEMPEETLELPPPADSDNDAPEVKAE